MIEDRCGLHRGDMTDAPFVGFGMLREGYALADHLESSVSSDYCLQSIPTTLKLGPQNRVTPGAGSSRVKKHVRGLV